MTSSQISMTSQCLVSWWSPSLFIAQLAKCSTCKLNSRYFEQHVGKRWITVPGRRVIFFEPKQFMGDFQQTMTLKTKQKDTDIQPIVWNQFSITSLSITEWKILRLNNLALTIGIWTATKYLFKSIRWRYEQCHVVKN